MATRHFQTALTYRYNNDWRETLHMGGQTNTPQNSKANSKLVQPGFSTISRQRNEANFGKPKKELVYEKGIKSQSKNSPKQHVFLEVPCSLQQADAVRVQNHITCNFVSPVFEGEDNFHSPISSTAVRVPSRGQFELHDCSNCLFLQERVKELQKSIEELTEEKAHLLNELESACNSAKQLQHKMFEYDKEKKGKPFSNQDFSDTPVQLIQIDELKSMATKISRICEGLEYERVNHFSEISVETIDLEHLKKLLEDLQSRFEVVKPQCCPSKFCACEMQTFPTPKQVDTPPSRLVAISSCINFHYPPHLSREGSKRLSHEGSKLCSTSNSMTCCSEQLNLNEGFIGCAVSLDTGSRPISPTCYEALKELTQMDICSNATLLLDELFSFSEQVSELENEIENQRHKTKGADNPQMVEKLVHLYQQKISGLILASQIIDKL